MPKIISRVQFRQCLFSLCQSTGEFRSQTDQRTDNSILQHMKGEIGRNRYNAVS